MKAISIKNLVPALGILIPILLFILSPFWNDLFVEEKSLDYLFTGESEITKSQNGPYSLDGIKVSYNEKELVDPRIIFLEISNNGGHPIKKDDFESPIEIKLEGYDIVSFRQGWSSPESIEIKGNINGEKIIIDPLLMNPGDIFEVRILVSGKGTSKEVNSRIAGVKKINKREVETSKGLHILKTSPDKAGNLKFVTSIHPVTLSILTTLFLALALLAFTSNSHENKNLKKSVYKIMSATIYLASLGIGAAFVESVPSLSYVDTMLIMVMICAGALAISKIVPKLFRNEASTPDSPNGTIDE